jgi:riboflavin kinase/FMN adenylyltransferase
VEDRVRLIRTLYGVETVRVLAFTEEFRHMRWDDFLETLVLDMDAAYLVCGWDYRFGFRGEGDPGLLCRWCDERGLGCDVIPRRVVDGITVSSTFLKALVEAGDVEAAARFYGHPHTMTGTVQTGRGLGRTLGFPTANLLPAPELALPRDGVYAVRAFAEADPGLASGQEMPAPAAPRAGRTDYTGVCNVGTRPTVDGHERTVETWLFDFDGDLYGRKLTLEFRRFLREERKFPDLESLRRQVELDRIAAMAEA